MNANTIGYVMYFGYIKFVLESCTTDDVKNRSLNCVAVWCHPLIACDFKWLSAKDIWERTQQSIVKKRFSFPLLILISDSVACVKRCRQHRMIDANDQKLALTWKATEFAKKILKKLGWFRGWGRKTRKRTFSYVSRHPGESRNWSIPIGERHDQEWKLAGLDDREKQWNKQSTKCFFYCCFRFHGVLVLRSSFDSLVTNRYFILPSCITVCIFSFIA